MTTEQSLAADIATHLRDLVVDELTRQSGDAVLSTNEAARMCGVHRNTFNKYFDIPKIHHTERGGYLLSDVRAFLKSKRR